MLSHFISNDSDILKAYTNEPMTEREIRVLTDGNFERGSEAYRVPGGIVVFLPLKYGDLTERGKSYIVPMSQEYRFIDVE